MHAVGNAASISPHTSIVSVKTLRMDCSRLRLVRCDVDAAGCRRLCAVFTAGVQHVRVDSSRQRRLQLMLHAGRETCKQSTGYRDRRQRSSAVSSRCAAAAAMDAGSGGGIAEPAPHEVLPRGPIQLLKDASWDVDNLVKDAVAPLLRKPAYDPFEVSAGHDQRHIAAQLWPCMRWTYALETTVPSRTHEVATSHKEPEFLTRLIYCRSGCLRHGRRRWMWGRGASWKGGCTCAAVPLSAACLQWPNACGSTAALGHGLPKGQSSPQAGSRAASCSEECILGGPSCRLSQPSCPSTL